MFKVILVYAMCMCAGFISAQKGKVQSAWRSLSDYEETLKDGKPNPEYLNKAKEAIDIALQNEETKKQARTHAYKLRISYFLYQQQLNAENEKLAASVTDKNERNILAYGNTPLDEFNAANEALNNIRDTDPKMLERIQQGLIKGGSSLNDEELKLASAAQQMKNEAANIASGKYRAKKYGEAADYFYKTAMINSILYKTKDTVDFYNACVAAVKSGDNEKILEYNKKMLDAKMGSPYNYESIYNVQITRKDTAAAMETLKKGRIHFPDDAGLLREETNVYLSQGRQQEALANLKLAISKDPSNALYYFIIGNIYDEMANPKDRRTRTDLPKPSNFSELFSNAETNYKKSIELKPANKDYLYNSYYNLGAMYNNYGGYIANRKAEKITDLATMQKENETKAQEYYKLAIPNLEQALNIRPDDRTTMTALRKLYLLTGNEAKAKEMSDRIKSGK
jgi:Tfp pilus assembly protein PilF